MSGLKALVRRVADVVLAPLVFAGARLLGFVRRTGVERMPASRAALDAAGVFPIRNHYYEPAFHPSALPASLRAERALPGVDLNEAGQLAVLDRFDYAEELGRLPVEHAGPAKFFYNNGMFCSGDAEYLYSMIRLRRPRRLVEVGSGYSTLMAREAIAANTAADPSYRCEHVCIEPYENPWLASLDVRLVRQPVQEADRALFQGLAADDILFIDSSHVIRPGGDVVFEYLEVLPLLAPGVLVHVHDIFTPRDYLDEWVRERVLFWNEQYLLEAFLSCNDRFEVIGALNYLSHHHRDRLAAKFPAYARQAGSREPGSFWMRVTGARSGAPTSSTHVA